MPDDLLNAAQQLFTAARSHAQWRPDPVSPALLRQVYDLAKMGPTSMNCQPMRVRFVVSAAAKKQLLDCLNPGNVAKTEAAPVVAVIGQDMNFVDHLSIVFPHKTDARAYYDGKPDVVASTALRNSSLQGAYLMLAARLVGLDCGPMSGFDAAAVDRIFWAGTSVRTNFLCNLGYAQGTPPRERSPRLDFDTVCRMV